MKKVLAIFFVLELMQPAFSQEIKVKAHGAASHPRLQAGVSKETILQSINSDEKSKGIFEQVKKNIEEYVTRHQTDSAWIASRLQMYWKTRSTDIFIKGGVYDHATGEAPVPTVRFPGARDNVTIYAAPALKDILPYMDDPRGIFLINRSKPGQPLEWAETSKTGRIIESINTQIMSMAYTAAVFYWLNDETKYAEFALDLFDTYMTGMQYRSEPIDLTHGHHQTLAGLSTFEVIQEVAILNNLTGIYDYLYDYLQAKVPGKMSTYTDVFKKWAEIQIDHGVAFNNWNLMQAKNVLNIALVLDDDRSYKDGRGNQYYTNYILNTTSQRQWALQKIVREGYDSITGLWNESPGYSIGVLNDFSWFVGFFDRYYKLDIVAYMPVLKKAVLAVAQYLFPSGYYSSFGDSHYGKLNLDAAYQMVSNARKNRKPAQEQLFTRYIKTIREFYKDRGSAAGDKSGERGRNINSLLYPEETITLDDKIAAGEIGEFITPVLYSSHVSYLALRSGMNATDGLMLAVSGSKGNHMHAGGMSIELYGKGYVLGPESGIGTSYFQPDYAEYYSQFPAHNTVAVDGISAYPVMKSNHGFTLKNVYPASGQTHNYFPSVCFADLYFLEPETQADQTRLTSIVRTSDTTGYYIDIFRSRRKDGKDKIHDYFYHNLGQQLAVYDNNGHAYSLQPTDKLSFGGGHLFAYDYFYDKRSIATDKDINAVFTLAIPGHEAVQMNMWMRGEKGREIFAVKSPKSKAIDRMGLPDSIVELPMPTIIARQMGEAWTKPFAVVFEPSTIPGSRSVQAIQSFATANEAPGFVGLQINGRNGSRQFVFSDTEGKKDVAYDNKLFRGTYGVINESENGLLYLFLGSGTKISRAGYGIVGKQADLTAVLEYRKDAWYFTCSAPVSLLIPVAAFARSNRYELFDGKKVYKGRRYVSGNTPGIIFELPSLPYSKIELR